MKGFITDRTYRIVDSKALVYLFGRLDNGESFLTITPYKPYFYIRTSDLDKAKKIATFDHQETDMKSMHQDPVQKIILNLPKDIQTVRKALEDQGIACFEADIRFTQRFLMEKGIYATLDIQGEYKKGRFVNKIYEDPILTPIDYTPKLQILSLDIETSLDGKDLYAITLTQDEKQITLFKKSKKDVEQKNLVVLDDEKQVLEKLIQTIQEWDPDIITGWHLIDFDLADLKRRCDKHNIPFILGRAEWQSTLRIETNFIRDSSADIAGRQVLDGIHLLKSSFVKLDDYKLETAAQHFLGKGKLIQGSDRHEEIERQYHEDPKSLIEYNIKDTELVLEILKKADLIDLTILRSQLTGLTMERVRASIASFDSVYIRELHKKGVIAPSGSFNETSERLTGGYVRESKPGIYDNILVLDFKSMYPSVIRTFNIDPLSYLPNSKQEKSDNAIIVAPNGAHFRNEQGILPQIIEHQWQERDKAKKKNDQVASLAIKTLMNSFFGVLASPNCRFFSLDIGNAITHFARQFIKLAAEKIEEQGYQVIYGDTDSVFVRSNQKSVEQAQKIGIKLQEDINKFYQTYVKEEYFRENFMELESEKIYRKFLMPKVRGQETGAKKRYAGLLVKNGKEKMDFTGLEFVRRDWTEVSKKFQLTLLEKIFNEEEVTEFVKTFVDDITSGKYNELLVYRKSIRKDLKSYTKTTPPHVKAARILEKKGKLDGTLISYIMTENGPEPVGFETANIDYNHYIEKQIKPIADGVLGFYNTNFDDLISGTSQKTLFGY